MTTTSRKGKLADTDTWTCPKCGAEWKAVVKENLRVWEPVTYIEVL